MEYSLTNILDLIPANTYQLQGELQEDLSIDNLKPASAANKKSLVFVAPNRTDKQEIIAATKASIIICDKEVVYTSEMEGKVLIQVDQPKLTFVMVGNQLFVAPPQPAIHPSAVIHPEAEIHETAYIGPNTYIGKVKIGEACVIHGNCFLYDNVQLGKKVILKAGCAIGSAGYGFSRNAEGLPIKFPHVGTVIIEDEVEIGCNSCIDLGSLGETRIGYGSKIDNLVHIGHNVQVGKCVYVAAQTSIAGSSVIGDFAEVWTSVGIADYSKIGKHASVGMGSVVIKEVPENKKCFGNPARVFGDNK